jgi:hypothetical protein
MRNAYSQYESQRATGVSLVVLVARVGLFLTGLVRFVKIMGCCPRLLPFIEKAGGQ